MGSSLLLKIHVPCLCALCLSGCSIVMALHGNQEPNFEFVTPGATKEAIDSEFHQSGISRDLGEGRTEVTYQYEMGNSPNPGRAAVNAYIDLYTLGLAEPILTVIELLQGDDVETRVVYGPDQRAMEILGYTPPPMSEALKAAQEEQDKFVRKRPVRTSDQPNRPEPSPEGITSCPSC